MNAAPIQYHEKQQEGIEQFIEEEWGTEISGNIVHEIESEYVHTDIQTINDGSEITLVTCGVGAREMNSPLPGFSRTELIMYASPELETDPDSGSAQPYLTACNELIKISKYPFREDTWIGPRHTINASEQFADTFGYPYFLFVEYPETAKLSKTKEVHFLIAVPIYEEELNQMMECEEGFMPFMMKYFTYFEDPVNEGNIFRIDVERPQLI